MEHQLITVYICDATTENCDVGMGHHSSCGTQMYSVHTHVDMCIYINCSDKL